MTRVGIRRVWALLFAAVLLLAAAGCGELEKLPPEEVLRRSVDAMKAANSFHFGLETTKLEKPMPGLFVSKAEGDVVKPDKLSGNLSATYSGLPINVKVIVDGESQYMTDPASARWTTMPADFNVAEFFNPTKGISDILGSVSGLESLGNEQVGGIDSYRLAGRVPTSALQSLSPAVTAGGELRAELWVGGSDFLVRKVVLRGPLMEGEPAEIERTITFSDYNRDVKIETPVVK